MIEDIIWFFTRQWVQPWIILKLSPHHISILHLTHVYYLPPPPLRKYLSYHLTVISWTNHYLINNHILRILNKQIACKINLEVKIPELLHFFLKNLFFLWRTVCTLLKSSICLDFYSFYFFCWKFFGWWQILGF